MATNKRLIKSNDEAAGGASFNTVLYTGDGSSNRQITGVGFEPDLVWIKDRTSGSENHWLFDVQRGGNIGLSSNLTGGDYTLTNTLSSFNDSGFTVGSDGKVNRNNDNYVAWCWKAGGSAVTNTDGTITSQVSANTEAGFSIVGWNGTTNTADTIGHGLSNAPTVVIMKNRDNPSDWFYYTSQIDGSWDFIRLNDNGVKGNSSRPLPTIDVFTQATMAGAIGAGDKCIAYCFEEVAGFSKFGFYSGNGGTQSITGLGFEPAFVLIKATNFTASWYIFDNKRGAGYRLFPNLSNAESYAAGNQLTSFDSDGFTLGSSTGVNGGSYNYIYMAFANQF